MKSASPGLNFPSLLDSHTLLSDRPFHHFAKNDVTGIKREKHEQRCVMKSLFLHEKSYKAVHRELTVGLGEQLLVSPRTTNPDPADL
jgi:hypothetical protein